MPWKMVEDTQGPMLRWQTALTAAAPDAGCTPLRLIRDATVHVEGEFGAASVEIYGSNSGRGEVPMLYLRTDQIEPVLPVYLLGARVIDADETTDLLVTVAGRR